MRMLLINSNRFKQPWPVIPFGLGCVAAAVEEAGHEVGVLDLCFSPNPGKDIDRKIADFRPETVGISIRNVDNSAGYNTEFLLECVRREVIEPCKRVFSGPIIIGGPAVGINGAEMLEYFDLEFAVRGDGETAMVEFLHRMENGLCLDGMPGLVQRVNGKLVEDNPPMPVEDMNCLPMDKVYDHIDLAPYRRFDSSIQVQTKRGCALSCSYCTYNRIEGRHWRLRDPQRVADDIERLVKKTGINHVEFTDSTFNIPLEHCKAVLRAVIAKGLKLRLRTMGLNPGAVDEELVDLMYEAGFREVDLGVESCCDSTLAGLGKHFQKEDVLEAVRLLHEKNIAVMWYLLVGGPGETPETLRETMDTINEATSPWDLVNFGIGLRMYKGAPIAERALNDDPSCTGDNFLRPVTYEPKAFGLETLKVLVKREALKQSNYYMYDEDEKMPPVILMLGIWILKIFAPRQPVWRFFIVIRKLQKILGINAVKRGIFELRNSRTLTQVEGESAEPVSRERVGNALAGISVLLTVALGYFTNPYWLLLTLGIALNQITSSVTNQCIIKSLLIRLGLLGERDLGRAEAFRNMQEKRSEA